MMRQFMKYMDMRTLAYAMGSVITGVLLRQLLNAGYQLTKGSRPPEDPTRFNTSGREALLWTLVLSLVSGLGKLAYKTIFTEPKRFH